VEVGLIGFRSLLRRVPMGAVDVWEVESSTEIEAARGRSPKAQLTSRHRDLTAGTGVLPAGNLYRFCDLTWFPRFICDGDRHRISLFQVRGLPGIADGVYAEAPPGATLKVILHRWFGDVG
jgi:hypothetical protein